MLIRAQEMARYVADGVLDAGLTGQDWIAEQLGAAVLPVESLARRPDVVSVADLDLRQAELRQGALGAGRAGGLALQAAAGLRGRDHRHRAGARDRAVLRAAWASTCNVEFSWGATEVKPPVLADAIVEATETGSTLRANRLRIIDTVMESNTQLIANRDALADRWKRTKIENIALLLQGGDRGAGPRRPDAERAARRPRRRSSACCRRCSGRRSRR